MIGWRRRNIYFVIILFIFFSGVLVYTAFYDSLTYDELIHYRYGQQMLDLDSTRFDNSKMPVSILNAIPERIVENFFPGFQQGHWQVQRIGRISTIGISILLGLIVYYWSKEWYGRRAGLFSLFLFVFEPNILAQSHLITTDIYATFTITLSFFCFWKLLKEPNFKWAIINSIVLGIAQLSKYTSVLLYPIMMVIAVIHFLPQLVTTIRGRDYSRISKGTRYFFLYLLMCGFVSILIINIGFLFNNTFMPLSDFQFKSNEFQEIQKELSFLSDMPVPLPYPYLEGLDWVLHDERAGVSYGGVYLLGHFSPDGGGFPGYFFLVFLLKVPIATQLFILAAIIIYIRRKRYSDFINKELFIFIPIVIFMIYFNFFFNAQIGIRFYLVVFPFLLVFAGSLVQYWEEWSKRIMQVFYLGTVYLVISVLSFFPYFIPYVNEIILDRKLSYQVMADSNIEWGQSERYLKEYLEDHPESIVEPSSPQSGVIIVGVNRLVGIKIGPEHFRWLRENFKPIDHIGYSYLIYFVSPEDLELIGH